MRFTYKNTGQYDISCKHCKHSYNHTEKYIKTSLSSNEIYHILTKEVMKHIIYPSHTISLGQNYKKIPKYPQKSVNLLLEYMNNYINFLEGSLTLAAQLRGNLLLETKLLWAWSDQLHKFVQNINKKLIIILTN